MILQRLYTAWRTHGSIGLVRHLYRHKCPLHRSLVFKKNCRSSTCSVPGLTVKRYHVRDQIDTNLLDVIAELKDGRILREANKLFLKKCELWLGQIEGRVVGLCWSRSQQQRTDYFVPLYDTDATILSCFVFPQYRGKGIYPTMLETMVNTMMTHDHIQTVYIDCKSWNTPSVRGIEKAGFIFVGQALRFVLFGKTKILRNRCQQPERNYQ